VNGEIRAVYERPAFWSGDLARGPSPTSTAVELIFSKNRDRLGEVVCFHNALHKLGCGYFLATRKAAKNQVIVGVAAWERNIFFGRTA